MTAKLAVLYQALPPPVIGGQRKKPRAGGYSDSSADIGYALTRANIDVITPKTQPDPAQDMDWPFSDTEEGIRAALDAGANTIWTNTVLFSGHPIEKFMHTTNIIGALPSTLDKFDDKFLTNKLFAEAGLPVAQSFLIGRSNSPADVFLGADDTIDASAVLASRNLNFPVIVKPIRGRGSQGVTKVNNNAEFNRVVVDLLDSQLYGSSLIVEEYLNGKEITISIMPPRSTKVSGESADYYWSLTPAVRIGHRNGVVPWNGEVLVVDNSRPMDSDELQSGAAQSICRACESAGALTQARNVIRIDCRADAHGNYKIFDFNMKPNITGPGRPGREKMDCLVSLSASAEGWSYSDLLKSLLTTAWRE